MDKLIGVKYVSKKLKFKKNIPKIIIIKIGIPHFFPSTFQALKIITISITSITTNREIGRNEIPPKY